MVSDLNTPSKPPHTLFLWIIQPCIEPQRSTMNLVSLIWKIVPLYHVNSGWADHHSILNGKNAITQSITFSDTKSSSIRAISALHFAAIRSSKLSHSIPLYQSSDSWFPPFWSLWRSTAPHYKFKEEVNMSNIVMVSIESHNAAYIHEVAQRCTRKAFSLFVWYHRKRELKLGMRRSTFIVIAPQSMFCIFGSQRN